MGLILSLILAYLLGSVTMGMVIARIKKTPDPRKSGSGNVGATNVMRTQGALNGVMVLAGDLLKGVFAILIGMIFHQYGFSLALVGLAAVIGHMYPVFYQFKGGKGVATAMGVLLALYFWAALVAFLVWIAVVLLTRYVSLASMAGGIGAAIFIAFSANSSYLIPVIIMVILIVWQHYDNIDRLLHGKESKIKF